MVDLGGSQLIPTVDEIYLLAQIGQRADGGGVVHQITGVGILGHHVDVGGPLELALQFGIQAVRGIVDAEPSCVLLAPASNSSRVA